MLVGAENKLDSRKSYKKKSEIAWGFVGETIWSKCNRIQFSYPLHSITVSLSSTLDSGPHGVLLFSVVGYHCRDCMAGVTVA